MAHPIERGFYPAITGVGGALGDECHSNDDIRERLSLPAGLSEGAIRRVCGIEQRYYAQANVLPSDMAIDAGRLALARAGMQPTDVDYFQVSTGTPDNITPAIAYKVHGGLKLPETTGASDSHAACAGAVDALQKVCGNLIAFDNAGGLIVASELHSAGLNPQDWRTSILFGDGAGAWGVRRLENVHKPVFASLTNPHYNVVHIAAGVRNLHLPDGHPDRYLHMEGAELMKHAADMMYRATVTVARKAGIYNEETGCVDHKQITGFFPHQANYAMIQPLAERLGIPNEKLAQTVKIHGNTGSASIPLAMWHAQETGQLEDGRALLVGFGAGLGAIACVIDVRLGAQPAA